MCQNVTQVQQDASHDGSKYLPPLPNNSKDKEEKKINLKIKQVLGCVCLLLFGLKVIDCLASHDVQL